MLRVSKIALLAVLAVTCTAQPQFWIALNFEVHLRSDGTAEVSAFLHPFTVDGESLYGNESVERVLRDEWNSTVTDILLMFTNQPGRLRYTVIKQFERNDTAAIYCDVYGYGEFAELRGAYITSVRLYLNTSEFAESADGLVKLTLRDSYTSRDPRSWIDVLRIKYDDDLLASYTWIPGSAAGPALSAPGLLEWRNLNEQAAPDFYVLQLRLEGFHTEVPKALKASVSSVRYTGDEIQVSVMVEEGSGALYVLLVAEGEQARRIHVEGAGEYTVSFPAGARSGEVQLWSDAGILDSRAFTAEEVAWDAGWVPGAVLMVAGLAIALVGIGLITRARRSSSQPSLG